MQHQRLEGIALTATPFSDTKKIVTLLTPTFGIVRFVSRNLGIKTMLYNQLCNPFVRGHYELKKGRSDLWTMKDGSLISYPFDLSASQHVYRSALCMQRAIIKSQFEDKPAKEVYSLFIHFLHHLPSSNCPDLMALAFSLKLVKLEGLTDDEHVEQLFDDSQRAITKTAITSSSFKDLKQLSFPIKELQSMTQLVEKVFLN